MSVERTIIGGIACYIFSCLFVIACIVRAVSWLIELMTPMLHWLYKVGMTFGVMFIGIMIFFRAPHVLKLIGLVLFIVGYRWTLATWW